MVGADAKISLEVDVILPDGMQDYVLRTVTKNCPDTADFVTMESNFDQDDIENVQFNSLADLDCFVSQRFNLPLRPYSTDIRAALELVAWNLENSEWPHFEIFRYEDHALPGIPFVASFEPDVWGYGETAPLAICQAALYRLKRVKVNLVLKDNNS